jgi:hypothetical protein
MVFLETHLKGTIIQNNSLKSYSIFFYVQIEGI